MKYNLGQRFIDPLNRFSYSENFINMCFSVTAEDYEINPVLARAMDRWSRMAEPYRSAAKVAIERVAAKADL